MSSVTAITQSGASYRYFKVHSCLEGVVGEPIREPPSSHHSGSFINLSRNETQANMTWQYADGNYVQTTKFRTCLVPIDEEKWHSGGITL